MQHATRTLLLVDDEENILRSLTRLFRQDGYRILTANNGATGLELLAQNVVGVIISDQRMPQMTGVEFLDVAKQRFPATMRIVLSGYTELESVTNAINRGAVFKFLTKPWDDALLRANVAEAFRIHELEDENEWLTRELRSINEDLEQRVADKTRELRINLHALQITHDVLEHLPVGVLGIDEGGLIVVANRFAHELTGVHSLMGRRDVEVLPSSLTGALNDLSACATSREFVATDTARWDVSCRPLQSATQVAGLIVMLREIAQPPAR